jgi:hypothetical protein
LLGDKDGTSVAVSIESTQGKGSTVRVIVCAHVNVLKLFLVIVAVILTEYVPASVLLMEDQPSSKVRGLNVTNELEGVTCRVYVASLSAQNKDVTTKRDTVWLYAGSVTRYDRAVSALGVIVTGRSVDVTQNS